MPDCIKEDGMSDWIKDWLAVLKDAVITKTAVGQETGGFAKIRSDMCGIMGVAADGHDFAAQFPVTKQNFTAGMGSAEGIGVAAGI